ncbi:amino acid ABC transporter substrate-binding protein [Propionivibrio dicarboxylicus]|uniref:Amino acid ABC transporter substrate-binding protein, PAAT family n=1 Tax=Propionivibrio dicarboxylicus TaxID=83767 RepID=A0A1G8KEH6_9RHOO|nr:amino acid ABC transporter substrate-binding protein [Propionivibrio dicarboxylicus]SDI41801.1 amino acid ABC transporter substrate-binding protein, PAAT family [Propionivibrio dicarboxylicus]
MKQRFLIMVITGLLSVGATGLQAGEVLDRVRQSGEVRCGVVDAKLPGFSILEPSGRWSGFWVDLCRAVAVASLGDPEAVRFVPATESTRAAALRGNAIDVMSANTTWTLSREAGTGIRFAGPVLYDGQGFLTHADTKAKDLKSFGRAKVCVREGTTTLQNLQELIKGAYPDLIPVTFQSAKGLMEGLSLRKCDLMTADRAILAATRLSSGVNKDRFVFLPEIVSKEPLGLTVRDDDPQWFNIVHWSMLVMITAEEKGISASNVDSFANSSDPEIRRLLGIEGGLGAALGLNKEWAKQIIRAVGNYGEVFDRNIGPKTPMGLERGLNALWSKGGLMYAPPVR